MPNLFKHNSTGSEDNSIFKGDWAINLKEHGGGPTGTTGFYNGVDIPVGGYAIYGPGNHVRIAANVAELLFIITKIGGDGSSLEAALEWAAATDTVAVVDRQHANIITDGLILNMDTQYTASYPRSGQPIYDLSGSNNDGTLLNGTAWNGSSIEYDGVDDKISTDLLRTTWHNTPFTLSSWFMWKDGGARSNHSFFELSRGGGADWGLVSVQRTQKFYFYWVGPGGGDGHVVESNLIQDNVPLNLTIRFDGNGSSTQQDLYNGTKIYLNGVEFPHINLGSAAISSQGRLFIGANQYPFKGEMYSFRFWDRELSQEEIVHNFYAEKNRYILENPNMVTDGDSLMTSWTSLASMTSRTPNAVQAPDGSMTATLFERISITKAGHAQIRQQFPTIDLTPNTTYQVQFWAKRIHLTERIDFEFSDTPQERVYLTDEWKFYSFELTTNSTFPVGEFIDIGSTTVNSGSQLGEQYSIWRLEVRPI